MSVLPRSESWMGGQLPRSKVGAGVCPITRRVVRWLVVRIIMAVNRCEVFMSSERLVC